MDEIDDQATAETSIQPDSLPIPRRGDSIAVLELKLTALADAVRRGESVALVTNYAACAIQERDATKRAVSEMSPDELQVWPIYVSGTYPLPQVDWEVNREQAPTSTKPLRVARRRAEALNRLYKTDKADAGHSVWFTNNELVHLPLVKAMARVIGAERDLLGGQCALNAVQWADVQSINEILSVSGQILGELGGNATISSAQQV